MINAHCLVPWEQHIDFESPTGTEDTNQARCSNRMTASLINAKNTNLKLSICAGIFLFSFATTYGIVDLCKHRISSHIHNIMNPPPRTVMEQLKLESESKMFGVGCGIIGGAASGTLLGIGPAFLSEKREIATGMILFSALIGCFLGAAMGGLYSYEFLSKHDLIE
ncbi:hypothetical protein ABK905_01065 [Acerihabitans sp. KWT182]|uniref:Uncharacterized protein n=1 Tax=Acerihabitans sp. KWT182 TaxID=3157919 RepID=A0AAU7QC81_9GAMM